MPSPQASRKAASKRSNAVRLPFPAKRISGTRTYGCLEPDPLRQGAFSILSSAEECSKGRSSRNPKTAVFDTRMKDFPEGAAIKLRKILEKKGKQVIAEASFVVVGMRGPLAEGEEERARLFGKGIAEKL